MSLREEYRDKIKDIMRESKTVAMGKAKNRDEMRGVDSLYNTLTTKIRNFIYMEEGIQFQDRSPFLDNMFAYCPYCDTVKVDISGTKNTTFCPRCDKKFNIDRTFEYIYRRD